MSNENRYEKIQERLGDVSKRLSEAGIDIGSYVASEINELSNIPGSEQTRTIEKYFNILENQLSNIEEAIENIETGTAIGEAFQETRKELASIFDGDK